MPDSKENSLRELYLKAGSALTLIPDEVWEAYHEKIRKHPKPDKNEGDKPN